MELHRVCRWEIESRGGGSLELARVAVGELSAVVPELLEFAWQAVVAEGPDSGARLEIEWHPARQLCSRCGELAERQPGSWLRLCPQCSDPLKLEGGQELDLVSLSFHTPEESAEMSQ
jgi:hydrogenase nickel incorporation protein HypA/HybF